MRAYGGQNTARLTLKVNKRDSRGQILIQFLSNSYPATRDERTIGRANHLWWNLRASVISVCGFLDPESHSWESRNWHRRHRAHLRSSTYRRDFSLRKTHVASHSKANAIHGASEIPRGRPTRIFSPDAFLFTRGPLRNGLQFQRL